MYTHTYMHACTCCVKRKEFHTYICTYFTLTHVHTCTYRLQQLIELSIIKSRPGPSISLKKLLRRSKLRTVRIQWTNAEIRKYVQRRATTFSRNATNKKEGKKLPLPSKFARAKVSLSRFVPDSKRKEERERAHASGD